MKVLDLWNSLCPSGRVGLFEASVHGDFQIQAKRNHSFVRVLPIMSAESQNLYYISIEFHFSNPYLIKCKPQGYIHFQGCRSPIGLLASDCSMIPLGTPTIVAKRLEAPGKQDAQMVVPGQK